MNKRKKGARRMTRDNLIHAINDNGDRWSCPSYNCDLPEKEGNSGACCLKCAERQLAEYEANIRADVVDEFVSKYREWMEVNADFCADKDEDCDGVCIECFKNVFKESEKDE